jgi:Hemerythrin HHE cation binding domain
MNCTSPSAPFRSTDRFRRQHEELTELGGQIFACLVIPALEKDPAPVRRLLARFKGKLEMHASMEDEALYPRLLTHADAEVRATADRLHGEVGALYQSVGAYLERWPTSQAISGNAPDFARETFEVLKALGRRMKREDKELYPLVDAHE